MESSMNSYAGFALSLILTLPLTSSNPRGVAASAADATHALAITCLIAGDIKTLTDFYGQALQINPEKSGDDYVEFRTRAGTLALFSASAQEKYIPAAASAGQNHSAILEFSVTDIDAEYARLQHLVKVWVKPPTTQPWGTRSMYFRDPEGNLVDFFTPASGK
jgi:uncharacterized glyoxalase superfamily protein PhnB